MTETATVICGEVEGSCKCVSEPHDGGPHTCACGGSWEWRGTEFITRSLPGTTPGWPNAPWYAAFLASAEAEE